MLALNEGPATGYVLIPAGVTPGVRRGAAANDEVLRAARARLGRQASREAARRATCGAESR